MHPRFVLIRDVSAVQSKSTNLLATRYLSRRCHVLSGMR